MIISNYFKFSLIVLVNESLVNNFYYLKLFVIICVYFIVRIKPLKIIMILFVIILHSLGGNGGALWQYFNNRSKEIVC